MFTIRASTLPSYADCPRRSASRMLYKQLAELGYTLNRLPPTVGAAIGTGAHAAAQHAMVAKINEQESNLKDGIEIAVESFRKEASDGIAMDTVTSSHRDAERQITILTKAFYEEVAPKVSPAAVEVQRMATVSDTVRISGKCDIETLDNSIDDWKFGSKYRPYHAQIGGYKLLRDANGGEPVRGLRMHHIPRVPVSKPFPGVTVYDYDIDVCQRAAYTTIKHIERDLLNWERVREPWVFPANPMSMMCSGKYCPAYGTAWCELGGLWHLLIR